MAQPIEFLREDVAGAESDLAASKASLECAKTDMRYWEGRVVEDMVKIDDARKRLNDAEPTIAKDLMGWVTP